MHNENTLRLYIVVRADLAPGAMAAQAIHAMRLWSHEHPAIDAHWYATSNNLVLLEAPDEGALKVLAEKAKAAGFACSVFTEPDYDDSVTAITIEPAGWRLLSSLPLALKRKTKKAAAA